jgi:CHASE3 domain sensor protein
LPFLSGRIGKMIFGLSILLLLALAFAADRATVLFSDSEKWVAHTREVQTTLARLRTRLYQAQACRLDYVLTGNPVALDSLGRAREGLAGALALAHALITDNRLQQERLRDLEPLLAERFALLDQSVALRQSIRSKARVKLRSPIRAAPSPKTSTASLMR